MPPVTEPLFRRRESVLFGLGAIALVLLAALAALRAEIVDSRRTFDIESHSIALQISRRLAEGETLIAALHGFHNSADNITDARFPSIVEGFLRGHPQVSWIASAEQVGAGAKADFEARLRREGFMGLSIRSLDAADASPSSSMRLPIYRLEPLTPKHARFLGVDITSRKEWRDALADAVDSGSTRAVATDAPSLGLDGVLLLRATYRGNVEPDSVLERRQQLAGMHMLFVDADRLLADVVTTLPGIQVSFAKTNATSRKNLSAEVFAWARTLSKVLPASAANIQLPLQIGAPLELTFYGVSASILLTIFVFFSLLHGLRQRRIAQREERRTFAQAQLAEITLHSIGEAVIRLDENGQVRYMNPVAEAMSGVKDHDACGQALEEVFDLNANGHVDRRSLGRLDGHADVSLNSSDGLDRMVACTVSAISDSEGVTTGRVLVMRDVSREHELSMELAYQASHDPLTELANRREFERHLARAVSKARSEGTVHTLFYIDLDQFKLVNDTCGHAAGDRMLTQIGGLLSTQVRIGDVLARLGGDEFGILLHGCTIDIALPIAERICEVVSAFRFVSGGRAFELGASIGVVEIGRDSGTADDVQRAADQACFAAKDSGRNRAHVYRHGDEVIRRNQGEMQWHSEIKAALKEGRMELHAQPIQCLRERENCPQQMHEILLRMVNAEGNLVPPMAFLPAAERYGLMGTVDRAVVEKSFVHVANANIHNHAFTINLSGQSFTDPELDNFILATAQRTGVDPNQVVFEVTETAAISNLAQARRLMKILHEEGFRFALDDFGAGLSSFGYLKQLPVDFIKIDGQFVRDIDSDPVAKAMVTSIVNVAEVLGITTIAEKVENEEVLSCLRLLGVDYVQGFHMGRPAPLANKLPLALSA